MQRAAGSRRFSCQAFSDRAVAVRSVDLELRAADLDLAVVQRLFNNNYIPERLQTDVLRLIDIR